MGDDGAFSSPDLAPAAARKRHQARTPMAARLQSPTSHHRAAAPFHLGSNDDQLERAQARAARAAAIRRNSTSARSPLPAHPDLLDRDQIMDLFHNCIKLASENKINQKNTWELGLIDHLSEIVMTKSEEDDETNFQKASCTLEAGVKIYSLRVDSVHSEAYKVLGGINRAGREEEAEGEHVEADQVDNLSKKELDKKISPLSTLESSFELLNVKKIDVAFTVDPLYHQTSAQFDEGGAKGLLLNNLGVYGGCRVLFDSFEVPEQSISCETQNDKYEVIDLSFANEYIEKMMTCMPLRNDISPTLRDIVNQFDGDNHRPTATFSVENSVIQDAIEDSNHADMGGNLFDDCGPWSFDQDDHESVIDDNIRETYPNFENHSEESGEYAFQDADVDEKLEKIAGFLSLGLGFSSHLNAWAGPDHWKYRKAKGVERVPVTAGEPELEAKKVKNPKAVSDIEFARSMDKDMPDIMAPPKNPKSLLLPVKKLVSNVTLPEDCHYRPESLVKLFIRPTVLCLGKKGRKLNDESRHLNGTSVPDAWDNIDMNGNYFDDVDNVDINSDSEDSNNLVCQPRQVNKVSVQYDKVSKQVNVHALKDLLWGHIQETVQTCDMGCKDTVSLKQVLGRFPSDHPTASPNDVSPHLFFICLLHLANEHCLSLQHHPNLDELDIHIPASASA